MCALQIANNLLPYLGARDDSCQTMFCGLHWEARSNNHYFMPQHAVTDMWQYVGGVQVEVSPPPPEHGRTAYLVGWLQQEDRRFNTEALRAVVRQICDAGHRVRMRYRDPDDGRVRSADDACEVDRLSRPHGWIPVRLFETDLPELPP